MKFIIIFSFTFLCLNTFVVFGQSSMENYNFIDVSINNLNNAIRLNNSNNVVELSSIVGSPYEDKSFSLGKVTNNLTKKSKPYYLRYNVYNDVIEIDDNTNTVSLMKSLNIYAIMNNREYHYEIYSDVDSKTDEGYFILLSKGENSSFFLRQTKKFNGKVEARDSYHKEIPASFVDSKSYYIKKDRILFPVSKSKKGFLKQFYENENELKKYMKSNKLNLKSEKDIIKVYNYLDSLL